MKHLALTLCLLLSAASLAAGQLEATRAGATRAREQTRELRTQQMTLRAELNALSPRIEALKSQAKGKLTAGGELDAVLKRSQALSGELSELAQSLATRQAELESANVSLLGELSAELARLRAEFDRQTDRQARKRIIEQLRGLRAEREQVRAGLPAAKVPAFDAVSPSDDPEDLLEQADALKDNEDKVRAQLKALEKRIAEAKEERELDGRVRQFLGEESLFDEQDRRLRVRRETIETGPAAANTRTTVGEKPADPKFTSPQAGAFDGTNPPAPTGDANTEAAAGRGGDPAGPQAGGPPVTRTVQGDDARPIVGGPRITGAGDDDDLQSLEAQRKKLKGLAEQLKAKAAELEKQAKTLK